MAEENTPSLGGFDIISDMIRGATTDKDGRVDATNEPPIMDPEKIKQELDKREDEKDTKNSGDSPVEGDQSDKSDTIVPDGADMDNSSDSDSDDSVDGSAALEIDNLGEFESDVTALLNERFAEELGWDIPEDEAPKSVKEFVEMMKGVVEEASQPSYANEEVKAFDEYVKNGGNLRDFYKTAVDGRVDVDGIDMGSSFDQKKVLSEHLSNQGYSEDRINKMLKRYEDAGVLEEEASDALELLKDYNEKNKQKLLEEQKKNAALAEEQQQKFVVAVEDSIKNLDNIRGVKISDKERKELLDYILVPDSDGFTQYQRDYMGDIKNLLESAYFTKKGDVLINKSKAQGKSDAVKNLHDKLKANKGNKSTQSGTQSSGKTSSGLSVLGSMLQGS